MSYYKHFQIKCRAQFHKGLLNIEDSRLLKLDLNRPLVANTKVFHLAGTYLGRKEMGSHCETGPCILRNATQFRIYLLYASTTFTN